MAHSWQICKHGYIVRRCRCPEGSKNKQIVECPDNEYHTKFLEGIEEKAKMTTIEFDIEELKYAVSILYNLAAEGISFDLDKDYTPADQKRFWNTLNKLGYRSYQQEQELIARLIPKPYVIVSDDGTMKPGAASVTFKDYDETTKKVTLSLKSVHPNSPKIHYAGCIHSIITVDEAELKDWHWATENEVMDYFKTNDTEQKLVIIPKKVGTRGL